jgi:hypothetical protein
MTLHWDTAMLETGHYRGEAVRYKATGNWAQKGSIRKRMTGALELDE